MNQTNHSRRQFLQQSIAASLGYAFLPTDSLDNLFGRKKHIAVQLYSVRDAISKDPKGTLKTLAQMGFKELEHAAYIHPAAYTHRIIYGFSPKEFRKIIDDLGMTMPSSHVVFKQKHWDSAKNDVTDEWKYVMEDANILGQKYLISPSFDADKTNLDEVMKAIERYNKVGMLAAKQGLRFGFHNHHQEFTQKFNDNYLYDIMLDNFDLKYVCQQLDIGNMAWAKVDPMRWLKKYPKHFELMHVKDKDKVKDESILLGDGMLNLNEILSFARKNTKIKYWVLEQESYGDKTPFECVEIDLDRIKNWYKF